MDSVGFSYNKANVLSSSTGGGTGAKLLYMIAGLFWYLHPGKQYK